MRLIFERGDERRPKGHALIYFRDSTSPAVLATYLIIPPIAIDFAKYLPPMFAAQGMASGLAQASSIVPLPPVPETVSGVSLLKMLAEERDDDLILAGEAPASDLERLLAYTTEAAQLYFHLYHDFARTFPETVEPAQEEVGEGPSADELSYALMGERERLGELAKLTGALRYAVEGNDQRLERETSERMRLLAKHMAPKFWAERIIDAARQPGPSGGRLSQLYLERCYKLLDEDYAAVAQLDEQIKQAG